jgi:cysteine desulfurase/selenocysteine lyase
VPEEIVFTRGATESINLVAHSWAGTFLKAGDRILLSQLEHHSNIVPWQLVADRIGATIDVAPLTPDGRIDLDAMAAMLTERHKLVALAHISNVLGSVLDARRAVELAHAVGARILLDGCQAVPRMPVDVQALGCDFYVFSAHKLYGPTGIGVLWARGDLLDAMPPMHGGGAMIDTVSFEGTTFAPPPARFEAGTPHVVGVLGLHAAIDYVDAIGLDAIHAHESALVHETRGRPPLAEQRPAVRAGRQRRHRLLRDRGRASARLRHHIGREPGRDPGGPSLRAASDVPPRRRRNCAGELRRV